MCYHWRVRKLWILALGSFLVGAAGFAGAIVSEGPLWLWRALIWGGIAGLALFWLLALRRGRAG
jgi:hypothetical protein